MVVGLRDAAAAIVAYKETIVDPDGGLALVMIDGLLLIPLAMAAFFYPRAALLAAGVVVFCTAAALLAFRERGRRTAVSEHAVQLQTTSAT
jgi:hypothetical protein